MKIEDECRQIIDSACRGSLAISVLFRNKLASVLTKFIARKEKEAFDKGYEAGRWDRPTNTSGRI